MVPSSGPAMLARTPPDVGSQAGLLLCLLVLLGLAGPSSAAGQSEYPVVLSAGTHSLTAPWYLDPVNDRFNPAFLAGTDHTIKSGDHWRFFYGVNIGFFQHHWWMSGISLEPELGIGRTVPGGFQADMRLGLGYMHFFWRRKTLELEDGRYVEATDWGSPSLILPLSLTLGYRGDPDHPVSIQPFVSARWGVQGLFLDEVPAMTHLFLLGGFRIERGGKTAEGGS